MFINFDIKECVSAKKKLNRIQQMRNIYKTVFSSSSSIGNCTNLYRKICPETCREFFEGYFKYAEQNITLDICDRGLTTSEFIKMCLQYKEVAERNTKERFPIETYIYAMLCHIIVETFEGQKKEEDFKKYLESLGCECISYDGKIDARYSIDIKAVKKGKEQAIQIKPISFFLSNAYDTVQDKLKMQKNYHEVLEKFGIETFYAVYSIDEDTREIKWLKNGKRFVFTLKDLLNEDNTFKSPDFFRECTQDFLPI